MFMQLLPLFIVGVFAAFAVFEAVRPGRAFPKVARWRIKGAFFFVLALVLTSVLPPLWEGWLGNYRLIDATGLGTWGGALFGFLMLELGTYVWHRSMHSSNFLWRALHQMHHSAERIDVWGALYFNPLDLIGFAFVYSFMLVVVAGVTPEAALIANLTATFCSFFQHSNIRTPTWLGYFIQRPEAHAFHHQRGVHAYNYSDFPPWDMLFGTWKNPARWEEKSGFYDGASARIPEMLIGMDVSKPREDTRPERVSSEQVVA
jgi:sterol desaturase/sphingolipid hydroxylase (fatty acid hydroxylase superfamily)